METSERPTTSALAIVSLVTGLTCIAPAAVVCGHVALSNINRSGGRVGGYGLALAGTILGYLGLITYVFMVIPVMFIGARAWKQGSDRAACIINQRTVQRSVREYQAANRLAAGAPMDLTVVFGPAGPPTHCPSGGVYQFSPTIPADGEMAIQCPHAADKSHEPADHAGW